MHRNRDAPGASTHAPPGRPRWAIVDPSQYPADPLLPDHRHELEIGSGIAPQVLADEGIMSLPSGAALPIPDALLRHPDPTKAARFGRRPNVGRGIYFPYHNAVGRSVNWKFKPDRPRTVTRPGHKPHTIKYEGPSGTRPMLYIPLAVRDVLDDRTVPLRFVEGEKKTLALVSRGLAAIGISGVDGWGLRLDELPLVVPELLDIELEGRIVLLEFDSDVASKSEVERARVRFRSELEARGAAVVLVTLPPAPDGSKQGPDDFLVNGGDLRELENTALVAAIRSGSQAGSAGSVRCDGTCPTSEALREQVAEYKAADELVRHGPFTADCAQVLKHLVTVAAAARANGKEKVSLLREEEARLALGDPSKVKTVSRAFQSYKPYQDDPTLSAALPFRLEWRDGGRTTHVDLYPLTPETPRTKAQQYTVLSHLPRDRKPAQRVKDRDDGCPRCHGADGVESRAVKRCLNDACGHTWHTHPVILGRRAPVPVNPAPTTLPLLVDTLPGQIVPAQSSGTNAGPFVPATELIHVAFTSRADQEAAAGPHYQVIDGPSDDPAEVPPPRCVRPECSEPCGPGDRLLCVGHRADTSTPAVAGGSE
jgi:Domain of unknown function (DUF3854)